MERGFAPSQSDSAILRRKVRLVKGHSGIDGSLHESINQSIVNPVQRNPGIVTVTLRNDHSDFRLVPKPFKPGASWPGERTRRSAQSPTFVLIRRKERRASQICGRSQCQGQRSENEFFGIPGTRTDSNLSVRRCIGARASGG